MAFESLSEKLQNVFKNLRSKGRLTERPTTLYSLHLLNTETMEADVLVEDDGFLNTAKFSPDGKKILISGSPESLGGIGKNVKEGQIPSIYDIQLYIMELQNREITPVTKEFDPSVQEFLWNRADGNIYFFDLAKGQQRVGVCGVAGKQDLILILIIRSYRKTSRIVQVVAGKVFGD